MTFTYNIAALTTDLARVRLKIGDTDSNHPLLSDEEIAVALTGASVAGAALEACYLILAKLARETDSNGAGISVSRSQKVQHYTDMIARLDRELAIAAYPTIGGVARDAASEALADTDFRVSKFSVGMDDHGC